MARMYLREDFLGLDNIGVFDRSAPLPTGGSLEQADGTAWMALFSQNMLELASELAVHDSSYEEMIVKFTQHFLFIAAAMNKKGRDGMWDEEDGFYYDLLRLPDGRAEKLKVRSLVGLLPLCATSIIEKEQREQGSQCHGNHQGKPEQNARADGINSSYRTGSFRGKRTGNSCTCNSRQA